LQNKTLSLFGVQRCGITLVARLVTGVDYVTCHVVGKFADITVGLQSAGLVVGIDYLEQRAKFSTSTNVRHPSARRLLGAENITKRRAMKHGGL
jgi:hypothetical protein